MSRSAHVPKLIRLPPEVAAQVEAIARREHRTFTGQLLLIVEQWLAQLDQLDQREAPAKPT